MNHIVAWFFFSLIFDICLLLSSIFIKSIGSSKIFDFRFSTDLHVWKCLEHGLNIFRKCLSVRLYPKFCRQHSWKTNARIFMKLDILSWYKLVLIRFWLNRRCCFATFFTNFRTLYLVLQLIWQKCVKMKQTNIRHKERGEAVIVAEEHMIF